MGKRLTKITTKTGDDGTTGLADGSRCLKSDLRLEVLGDLDELNCFIGMVQVSRHRGQNHHGKIRWIQDRLFDLGGEVSTVTENILGDSEVQTLEVWVEGITRVLPPLENFILPGGPGDAGFLHLARAVCRRAERHMVALSKSGTVVNEHSLVFLNRLSDFLFQLARWYTQGGPKLWKPKQKPSSNEL